MMISVVIPVYGAPNSIPLLHKQIRSTMITNKLDYELILINDGCPQGSWLKIQEACKDDSHVIGLNLVRNFGQHAAISAGLSKSSGDWVVVMDCDLQDDPKYIPLFLEKALGNKVGVEFKVVLARRLEREEGLLKRVQSWLFYFALRKFLGVEMDHHIGNFGLYKKEVIASISKMGDYVRFFPFLVSWVGYPVTFVDIKQNSRSEGRSSYTLSKALKLAFDVAVSSSNKPLIWSIQIGSFCALASLALAIVYILRFFTLGHAPSGWTSLIVAILFSTGLILVNLGVLGLYLAKTFDQVKNRPFFIVDETIESGDPASALMTPRSSTAYTTLQQS